MWLSLTFLGPSEAKDSAIQAMVVVYAFGGLCQVKITLQQVKIYTAKLYLPGE